MDGILCTVLLVPGQRFVAAVKGDPTQAFLVQCMENGESRLILARQMQKLSRYDTSRNVLFLARNVNLQLKKMVAVITFIV